jgi:hypothetical protein
MVLFSPDRGGRMGIQRFIHLTSQVIAMTETVRWNIEVSEETDRSVRAYLAEKGRNATDLSRTVEQVITKELFREALAASRARNADLSYEEAEDLVEEALQAVRSEKRRERGIGTD